MALLALPGELLLQVVQQLRDSQDIVALKSVACTCKALREVAEIYLYSTAKFKTLSSLYRFLDAVTYANPPKKDYLRDLQLLFSTSCYDYQYKPPFLPDLTSFPNLTTFVSESPECQPASVKGTHWGLFKDSYIKAFTQASLLSTGNPRPLQNLRSLVLHWTAANRRFWDITPASPIFLIPQLQSLEISCAIINREESGKWNAEGLQHFKRQTQLKSLIFTECTIPAEALHLILSFPRALRSLTLCEKFYHRDAEDSHAVDSTELFNGAIAQQAESLEYLNLNLFQLFSDTRQTLVLSLSDFPVLSHLQLGPFLRTRAHEAFKYVLGPSVPPALKSLRLDEFAVSRLRGNGDRDIFAELSVEELLGNAEANGTPFTLDISLEHLPALLTRRPHFHARDIRPVVRTLVEKLGESFQQLQRTSVRSLPEAGFEQTSDNPASSRLRVLTNKARHKIPPYLHDEGPPRFVVRYDSWYPERFVKNPYTADILPLDRDISSDDEHMDAAFSSVDSDLLS